MKIDSEPNRFFLAFYYFSTLFFLFMASIPAYALACTEKQIFYFLLGVLFHRQALACIHRINQKKYSIHFDEKEVVYHSSTSRHMILYRDVKALNK